jgi:hypothetical protein
MKRNILLKFPEEKWKKIKTVPKLWIEIFTMLRMESGAAEKMISILEAVEWEDYIFVVVEKKFLN